MLNNVFSIFFGLVGLCALYFGVTRKSSIFQNGRVQEKYADSYNNFLARTLMICGGLLVVVTVLELLKVNPWITMALNALVIVLAGMFLTATRHMMKRKGK